MYTPVRWKQRFQNFEKVYAVFQRRIADFHADNQSEANQMSLIQAFEVLSELSWKTLKDYLENEGTPVSSPKQVIRQAYQFEIIRNGEDWMEALVQRNLTVHTYDEENFKNVLAFISKKFEPIVSELYTDLKKEL